MPPPPETIGFVGTGLIGHGMARRVGMAVASFDFASRGGRMGCGCYQTRRGDTRAGSREAHRLVPGNALKDVRQPEAPASFATRAIARANGME